MLDLIVLAERALKIRAAEQLLLERYKLRDFAGTVHTCIGQELVPVLVETLTRDFNPFVFSNHRGHGHFLSHTNDYTGLFAEFLGVKGAVSAGIGGSQHLYKKNFLSNGIQGQTSSVAVGFGLNQPSIIYLGDGTFGEGALYEAINLSMVFNSKLLYVVEQNEISQSTPTTRVNAGTIRDKFNAFGIDVVEIDLFLGVEAGLKKLNKIKSNLFVGPVALVFKVPRLMSHSKGDDNRSVKDLETLKKLDPLHLFTAKIGLDSSSVITGLYQDLESEWETLLGEEKLEAVSIKAISQSFENTVYTRFSYVEVEKLELQDARLNEVINTAISAILDDKGVFVGEDIKTRWAIDDVPYGGAFGVSMGLSEKYPEQVLSTPISESGIIGMATGFAMSSGRASIAEIMFADFASLIIDQVYNGIEKYLTMFGKDLKIPLVIRLPYGMGRGYGPTHSQSPWELFQFLTKSQIISLSPFLNLQSFISQFTTLGLPIIIFEPKLFYGLNQMKIWKKYQHLISKVCDTNLDRKLYIESKRAPRLNIIAHGSLVLEALDAIEEFDTLDLIIVHNISKNNVSNIIFRNQNLPILVIEEANNGFGPVATSLRLNNNLDIYTCGENSGVIPANAGLEQNIMLNSRKIKSVILELLE